MFIMAQFVSYSYAGTYWVSSTGTAGWSNCSGASPLSGTAACALSTANANAVAGDTVYLRAGTYTITGDAISPAYSGSSASSMITYSGYGSETATIYGANDVSGYSSRGIYLSGKSYVKVTNLTFTNLRMYLWIVNGGHHNEISYCTFKDMRDVYNVDIVKTGTYTGTTGLTTVLTDSSLNGSTNQYAYRRVFNITDGSYCSSSTASGVTTVTCSNRPLVGGRNNYWSAGDSYKITHDVMWGGSYIYQNSTHNWIHHNVFKNYGAYSLTNDEGVALQIGITISSNDDNTNYNTIEYNHLYASGHHVLGGGTGQYNVFRNNYAHNEGWYSGYTCPSKDNGVCGYRVFYIVSSDTSTSHGGYSLFEGNNIGYGAQYGGPHLLDNGGSGGGMVLTTPSNIFRYNAMFANVLYGFAFAASTPEYGKNNRVYNNSFYRNGWNEISYGVTHEDDPFGLDIYRVGLALSPAIAAGYVTGNAIKNNLFYRNWSDQHINSGNTYYPSLSMSNADVEALNTISNNYYAYDRSSPYGSRTRYGDETDPLFVDPDVTRPLGASVYNNYTLLKPDLRLQSSSPAKDRGIHLTITTNAGSNSYSLAVNDASYFQDGTWGSDLARAASTFNADWIAVGNVKNISPISSISLSNNVITLSSALTWKRGDKVWLYKKSDGERVLYGTAPDMGAHEIVLRDPPPNFRTRAQ